MFKHRKPTAILLHDGALWRAVILARSRSGWTVRAAQQTAGRSANRLPGELLDFAASHRAKRVAVLLNSEVHTVHFSPPPDAEPEELQTALGFEAAQELGSNAIEQRLAVTGADLFDMGAEPDDVLVAAYEDDCLKRFAHDTVDRDLHFTGCGSLELAALAWHWEAGRNAARLLVLKQSSAFYAAPAIGDAPFLVATLPVGLQADSDPLRENERLDRAARRLATHADAPLIVLSCAAVSEAVQTRLHPLLSGTLSVEWHALSDVVAELARPCCTTTPGLLESRCALVGPKPAPRDPYRAGTWLFLTVVLFTFLWVGFKWHDLDTKEKSLRSRKAAWEKLEAARKAARGRVSALRSQRDAQIAIREAVTGTRKLPRGVLPTLDALVEAMPPYTRINRLTVAEDDGDGLLLSGNTAWQEGLTGLTRALKESLHPHDLMVQQETIELADGTHLEQAFTYRIHRRETR